MRKIIAIGESVLDTIFVDNKPIRSFVGGRIACAAASLGQIGLPTQFVSETTTDAVGDIIINYLHQHHVGTTSVDRYPDGATPFAAIFQQADGTRQIINYGSYAKTRFDVIWPRIDEDDIVLFGSLYAIDLPQRERLFELIRHAAERKAILVYLPGFQHGISYRLTKVMPHLLENLDLSDIVIAHQQDVQAIFPGENREQAYRNHFEFYCRNYIHIDNNLTTTHCATGTDVNAPATDNLLGWQAGLTAGLIAALFKHEITRETLTQVDAQMWRQILSEAVDAANNAAGNEDNCVNPTH